MHLAKYLPHPLNFYVPQFVHVILIKTQEKAYFLVVFEVRFEQYTVKVFLMFVI